MHFFFGFVFAIVQTFERDGFKVRMGQIMYGDSQARTRPHAIHADGFQFTDSDFIQRFELGENLEKSAWHWLKYAIIKSYQSQVN